MSLANAIDNDSNQTSQTFEVVVDPPGPKIGTYHALLIAVQDYPHDSIKDLDFPIQDAERLAEVLKKGYLFSDLKILKNPTRREIILAFDQLSNQHALSYIDCDVHSHMRILFC